MDHGHWIDQKSITTTLPSRSAVFWKSPGVQVLPLMSLRAIFGSTLSPMAKGLFSRRVGAAAAASRVVPRARPRERRWERIIVFLLAFPLGAGGRDSVVAHSGIRA